VLSTSTSVFNPESGLVVTVYREWLQRMDIVCMTCKEFNNVSASEELLSFSGILAQRHADLFISLR
jgi:hypothetical protein